LSLLLKSEGFTVLTAKNGSDALDRLNTNNRVSLILLDLWMPVMNGWEFLRQKLRAVAIADIPVVVVSAVPLPGCPDGADMVLPKPVNPRSLIDAIKSRLKNDSSS
jgi:CheY-like chemotaxis protein